jgi:hypothetical protein
MTSLSISATPSLGADILARIRNSSTLPVVDGAGHAGARHRLCCPAVCGWARQVNGVSTWLKPAKFFSSLAIQFATVGWALSYLPAGRTEGRA